MCGLSISCKLKLLLVLKKIFGRLYIMGPVTTTCTTWLMCIAEVALFPGPAQLFVTSSTVKRERPGIFSHVSDVRIESVVERV